MRRLVPSTSLVATIAVTLTLTPFPAVSQEPNFGRALTLQGEDLLIGQPVNWYGPGAVYAYRAGAEGAWSETGVLTAPGSGKTGVVGPSCGQF